MRVLFCTDGSRISYQAIQNFYYWMKPFTADIICAIDWSFLPDTVSIEDSEFAMQCTNSADSILNYSERFLQECGITVGDKIKMCGSTVDCILEACGTRDYDFIVLGSHGKKGLQKWLGSVSQEVASASPVSVYISKDKSIRQKVLFTVDTSEYGPQIVSKAIDSFNFENKDIYLTTVYEIPDYLFLEGNIDANWILEVERKQETSAMMLLNEYEKMFKDKGLDVVKKVVLRGTPAPEIIKFISKEHIDLVVCGINDRKYLSKFLLTSVSKRILEGSKSDVLIIRL